jgi:hypothetical protein
VNVRVHDGNGGLADVTVRAFIGKTVTGYSSVTNEYGEAIFGLPEGENYRFCADYTASPLVTESNFGITCPKYAIFLIATMPKE